MFFGLRVKVIGNFFYYALSFLLSYFWGSVNVDGSVKSPNLELLPPYVVVAKEVFMDYIVVAQIISDFLRVHQY
jgi:hypothetical protein